jgi:hypothetical protein
MMSTAARQKAKPGRSWSHQNDLSHAIGKKVRIEIVAGSDVKTREGRLLAADQFTLKLELTGGNRAGDVVIYFKSALMSFEVRA